MPRQSLFSRPEAVLDRRAGGLDPRLGLQEALHGELVRLLLADHLLVPGPVHPPRRVSPGSPVRVLGVPQRLEPELPVPRQVPGLVDEPGYLRLHDHRPRVLPPRPGQVAPYRRPRRVLERRLRREAASLEHEPGGLAPVGAALCRGDVLLVVHGPAQDEHAVLEHGRRVAEDEVDGPGDDAVAVELGLGVRVQRVLERVHPAVEEDGFVRLHQQRHRLVLGRARRVAEPERDGHEPVAQRVERGRLEGGEPVREVPVPRDDRLLRAVAVHGHVGHLLGDGHVLLVHAFLHVDHVPSRVRLGHGLERVVDGLELPAAVLGHHHVGLGRVLEPLELPPLLLQCRRGVVRQHGQHPPPVAGREHGQERRGLVDDGQRVAGQLLAVLHGLRHLLLDVAVREPVDARLLVRDHRAQPDAQLVTATGDPVHAADVDAVERAREVVFRVAVDLLAVRHGRLHAWVVAHHQPRPVERGGDRIADGRHGGADQGLGRRVRGVGGLGEALLARVAVVRLRAHRLDALGHADQVGPRAAAAAAGGGRLGGRRGGAVVVLGAGVVRHGGAAHDDDDQHDGRAAGGDHHAPPLLPLPLDAPTLRERFEVREGRRHGRCRRLLLAPFFSSFLVSLCP
ncbi:hypothetical protein PR202_ga21135 [Eleusine coracana subsp. coracana]|uniref:Uncharacterized protein n=1 Tax=Eleusine coracana subsp. coracana TaxID=191504 RepID=A0AAV5D059_ELECO|nr:hypothetical protein PR202_ga21135 [Eleusine coracana subsp. coracana]